MDIKKHNINDNGEVDNNMKCSALIGNPVDHSTSPFLFEIISKKLKIEYAHIKVNVQEKEFLKETINAMRKLKFIGFNITIPYKLDMYNLVDYCDEEASKIHSINSIAIKDNKLVGTNTDGKAAINSIEHFYNITSDDRVVIFGAGGVAYPIVYEIAKKTSNIVIFNEDKSKAIEMLNILGYFDLESYDFDDFDVLFRKTNDASLIINATSVGMIHNEFSLIALEMFEKYQNRKTFFDVVFNPSNTELIQNALNHGHLVINGVYMLVYQAILVLEFWLGETIHYTKEEIDEIVNQMMEYTEGDNSD